MILESPREDSIRRRFWVAMLEDGVPACRFLPEIGHERDIRRQCSSIFSKWAVHLAGLEIKPARLEDSQHINSTSIIHYSSNGSSSYACVGETFSLGRRVFVS